MIRSWSNPNFFLLSRQNVRHPVTLPTNKHEGFASWRQNELHEEDDEEDDHQLAVMWVENFDDKGMTATRHIIGLGNWRWWAFISKWDNSWCSSSTSIHVCVPATYDEIWGNKIITSGFKLLLLLLAHSTVCWWCSWRKYRWITPKRVLIFVYELDGRGVPPIPSSIIISPREQEFVHRNWDSVRFVRLHLSIGLLQTPSQILS